MISADDYLYFVDDALDGMVDIVVDLGDELANRRLDLPGANSPYAVLTHCLGVIEYWAGHLVAGRVIERDRPAEFRDRLGRRPGGARARARASSSPISRSSILVARRAARLYPMTRVFRSRARKVARPVHIYEELAQHRGQMETTRDVIRAEWAIFR